MSKRATYKIGGKEYQFSNARFNDVINQIYPLVKEEKKPEKYNKGDFFEDIGSKCGLSGSAIRQYCKPKGSAPSDMVAANTLADALNCKVTDFLEEYVQKAEVTIDMMHYTKEDKELVVSVYNDIIRNIDLFAKIKTTGGHSKKEGEKSLHEALIETFHELVKTAHLNSLEVADGVVGTLERILEELMDFITMTAAWIPYRWENFSEWYLLELQCYLNNGPYSVIDSESSPEEIQKTTLYSYLKERFPEVDEDYDFWALYSEENLMSLYVIELSSLIRQVFLNDFEYMFKEW